jgi:hypothetical protein
MSEDDKAAARALALDIIRDYRDRACPEPTLIDADQLKRMMDWLVCAEVPDECVSTAATVGVWCSNPSTRRGPTSRWW